MPERRFPSSRLALRLMIVADPKSLRLEDWCACLHMTAGFRDRPHGCWRPFLHDFYGTLAFVFIIARCTVVGFGVHNGMVAVEKERAVREISCFAVKACYTLYAYLYSFVFVVTALFTVRVPQPVCFIYGSDLLFMQTLICQGLTPNGTVAYCTVL